MAPESLTLTTPEAKPANSKYDIAGIRERWLPLGQEAVEIDLLGQNGEMKTVVYGPLGLIGPTGLVVPSTPTGATLLRVQNRKNFAGANDSRQKEIYKRLTLDGVLVGSVTGTPD